MRVRSLGTQLSLNHSLHSYSSRKVQRRVNIVLQVEPKDYSGQCSLH